MSLHVCRKAHVLFTLFVFVCVYSGIQDIVLCFCYVCLRLVHPMLPVSLDCFCFVFRRLVYPVLPGFSGLSICDCPFGIL
jgi:hypothetical protein